MDATRWQITTLQSADCSSLLNWRTAQCAYPLPIVVAAFRKKTWNKSSSVSSRRRRREWDLAFLSATPSLTPTVEKSGRRIMPDAARHFIFACPSLGLERGSDHWLTDACSSRPHRIYRGR